MKRVFFFVRLCALLLLMWASFGYARDISHNATPNAKEKRAWVAECRATRGLPCVP